MPQQAAWTGEDDQRTHDHSLLPRAPADTTTVGHTFRPARCQKLAPAYHSGFATIPFHTSAFLCIRRAIHLTSILISRLTPTTISILSAPACASRTWATRAFRASLRPSRLYETEKPEDRLEEGEMRKWTRRGSQLGRCGSGKVAESDGGYEEESGTMVTALYCSGSSGRCRTLLD